MFYTRDFEDATQSATKIESSCVTKIACVVVEIKIYTYHHSAVFSGAIQRSTKPLFSFLFNFNRKCFVSQLMLFHNRSCKIYKTLELLSGENRFLENGSAEREEIVGDLRTEKRTRKITNTSKKTKERFSIECRKTKTKVITLANHKRHTQSSQPHSRSFSLLDLLRSHCCSRSHLRRKKNPGNEVIQRTNQIHVADAKGGKKSAAARAIFNLVCFYSLMAEKVAHIFKPITKHAWQYKTKLNSNYFRHPRENRSKVT